MKHGTTTGYREGCRCTLCTDAKRESNRKYKTRKRVEIARDRGLSDSIIAEIANGKGTLRTTRKKVAKKIPEKKFYYAIKKLEEDSLMNEMEELNDGYATIEEFRRANGWV